jgi:phage pi2 protein 07
MTLYKSKKLLNIDNNPKTIKGQKYKVMTAILYLAPAKISGFNVCPFADDCALTCLNTAGRGQMNSVQLGRINKTRWYFLERKTFMIQLHKEIKRHINRCKIKGFKPAFRINGMSDLKVENMGLLEKYPSVQFYDYTKNPIRMKKFINKEFPKNYHLTFSLGSSNKEQAKQVLKAGGNVAVVFRNKKLPKTFWGHKVFNADKTDLRFKDPLNVIMGLYAKGKARQDQTGFVQDV